MIKFRVRYIITEHVPHVYCRIFSAKNGGTFEGLGNLTMRRDEFDKFRVQFDAEFVAEEK